MSKRTIILNDEAFQTAMSEFDALSKRVKKLRKQTELMMKTMEHGFNTPAGKKLIASCKSNVLDLMEDQQLVLEHLSKSLEKANTEYKPIFEEYDKLNTVIKESKM